MVDSALRRIASAEKVEEIIGRPAPMILMKQLDHLDEGCQSVLRHSPLAGFGFRRGDGSSPTSTFIGGRPGFVEVISAQRFSFEFDEEETIDTGGSFVFFLPGVGETLRLNGCITGRTQSRLVVDVQETYVHCARCVLRSRLWDTPPPSLGVLAAQPTTFAHGAANGALKDPCVAEFLGLSPFLVVSTWDESGCGDTSPRGDHPGFVRILDGHTLAIPDRKGNQRADTFHNLLRDNRISLAAVIPGRADVLHLRGSGFMTDDAAVLADMAVSGVVPHAALIVDVEDARLAANPALERANVWDPSAHVDRASVPDLMALGAKHMIVPKTTAVPGAPNATLIKPLAAFPGLIRMMVDIGYRVQLKQEGYNQDSRPLAPSMPAILWRRALRAAQEFGHRFKRVVPDGGVGQVLGTHDVRVVEVAGETEEAVSLVLENESGEPFTFRPGQFFTLVVDIDGATVRRAYSASSLPGEARLTVTVKRVSGGRCSAYLNDRVRVGDRLQIRGPSGDFFYEKSSEETVLVAAGSGITPLMSILRAVLADPAGGRVVLFYGSRRAEDIIFAGEINALSDRFPERLSVRHYLTQPPPIWEGGRGRLDEDAMRRELGVFAPSGDAQYYLCGPEPMMVAACACLTEIGVPAHHIHQERFVSAAGTAMATTQQAYKMIVYRKGKRIGATSVEAGQTILEAGLFAGLPMSYSCTVGNCGECLVKLRRGEVVMAQPNCLTPELQASGSILTCVGQPRSKIAIELPGDGA